MGMFDNLRCEYPLPGLADPTSIEFQTKSLGAFMDDFRITPLGELQVSEYDVEDRSDPSAEGISRVFGSATRIHTQWAPVNFSGILNFYGDANTGQLFLIPFTSPTKMFTDEGEVDVPKAEWFEYNALVKDGQVLSVERVTDERLNFKTIGISK